MRKSTALIAAVLMACLEFPAWARVEDYGNHYHTHVGRGGYHGPEVDRRGGPGWAGVIAGGILGAAAGLALSHAAPPVVVEPPPVYVPPPVVGTVVPDLPPGCYSVPAYNGVPVYNCGNVYYQPFWDGGAYMYEVVPVP